MANFVTNQFPNCCGAQIITNLPSYFYGDKKKFEEEWVKKLKIAATMSGISVICLESKEDLAEFGPLLKQAGFELVSSTQNRVYPYNVSHLFVHTTYKIEYKL